MRPGGLRMSLRTILEISMPLGADHQADLLLQSRHPYSHPSFSIEPPSQKEMKRNKEIKKERERERYVGGPSLNFIAPRPPARSVRGLARLGSPAATARLAEAITAMRVTNHFYCGAPSRGGIIRRASETAVH